MSELTKHLTQYDMTLYSGEGNIHSDPNIAFEVGFERTVAQGMMLVAYASELLTELHGEDWLTRGELSVKFTAPVFAGDAVRVQAEPESGGYAVEAANQDGTLVMVGNGRIREDDT